MKLMIPLFTAALVAAPGVARADDDAEARRKLTFHATSVFQTFDRAAYAACK